MVRLLEVDIDNGIKNLAEIYYEDEIITKEEKENLIKDVTTNIEYEDSYGIITSSEENQKSDNDSDDEWNEDNDDDIYYDEEEEEYDDKCKTQW